jgi:UDP-N-acetylmuramoylalanine--D-glutamate ligase
MLIESGSLPVIGLHNIENALAAIAAASVLGVGAESCRKALEKFKGLPNRMEEVSRIDGITFFNDSKATNVDAVVKSLIGLESPVVLIAGGYDKGADFSRLLELSGIVRAIVTIGEAAEKIERALEERIPCERAATMREAVEKAKEKARRDWLVVLSPACASFDMFDNFEHRGDVFRDCVISIGKTV